jgi:hypothetical protein
MDFPKDRYRCSVDPLSMGLMAASLFGGMAASKMAGGGSEAATPAAAPAAPATQQQTVQPTSAPTGTKPSPKSQQPTFLGAAATPAAPTQSGQKTLLGQ